MTQDNCAASKLECYPCPPRRTASPTPPRRTAHHLPHSTANGAPTPMDSGPSYPPLHFWNGEDLGSSPTPPRSGLPTQQEVFFNVPAREPFSTVSSTSFCSNGIRTANTFCSKCLTLMKIQKPRNCVTPCQR